MLAAIICYRTLVCYYWTTAQAQARYTIPVPCRALQPVPVWHGTGTDTAQWEAIPFTFTHALLRVFLLSPYRAVTPA